MEGADLNILGMGSHSKYHMTKKSVVCDPKSTELSALPGYKLRRRKMESLTKDSTSAKKIQQTFKDLKWEDEMPWVRNCEGILGAV